MNGRVYYVYVMCNKRDTVFYIGITGNLQQRVYQHKEKMVDGFTKRYNIDKLIYYETWDNPSEAIAREKQLKKWRREKKLHLIKQVNPSLRDLANELT